MVESDRDVSIERKFRPFVVNVDTSFHITDFFFQHGHQKHVQHLIDRAKEQKAAGRIASNGLTKE